MKHLVASVAAGVLLTGFAALADDLPSLAGKWSTKKVNDEGQKYTQTIEVKKDKFVFEILGGEERVVLHAEGDVKVEKLGPFSSVKFYHIKAGASASDLRDVDDEYVSVYLLDGDSWTLASNFDKERDRQKAAVDVYRRAKTAEAKPAK